HEPCRRRDAVPEREDDRDASLGRVRQTRRAFSSGPRRGARRCVARWRLPALAQWNQRSSLARGCRFRWKWLFERPLRCVGPRAGAWLRTAGGRMTSEITEFRGLRRFLLCGVIAGPLLGASIGTAAAAVGGHAWWPRLPMWFVGDAVGALAVAPAVLLFASGR